MSKSYQTVTTETVRDKFVFHAGEIETRLQAIKIELSNKTKNSLEITRMLKREKKLLLALAS